MSAPVPIHHGLPHLRVLFHHGHGIVRLPADLVVADDDVVVDRVEVDVLLVVPVLVVGFGLLLLHEVVLALVPFAGVGVATRAFLVGDVHCVAEGDGFLALGMSAGRALVTGNE